MPPRALSRRRRRRCVVGQLTGRGCARWCGRIGLAQVKDVKRRAETRPGASGEHHVERGGAGGRPWCRPIRRGTGWRFAFARSTMGDARVQLHRHHTVALHHRFGSLDRARNGLKSGHPRYTGTDLQVGGPAIATPRPVREIDCKGVVSRRREDLACLIQHLPAAGPAHDALAPAPGRWRTAPSRRMRRRQRPTVHLVANVI